MEFLQTGIELLLHVDHHLTTLVAAYGVWVYALLFLIIFCETGLIVTPFLPGDSLLFVTGALAATGELNPVLLFGLLALAAIPGDTLNYWIGASLGVRLLRRRPRWLKAEYLQRTERFYAKHGAKTLVLARFAPVVRTFAPFLAGMGRMHYGRFLTYNVVGGVVWVASFVFAGLLFGNLPVVRDNFGLVAVAIVVGSLLPGAVALWKHRLARRRDAGGAAKAGAGRTLERVTDGAAGKASA